VPPMLIDNNRSRGIIIIMVDWIRSLGPLGYVHPVARIRRWNVRWVDHRRKVAPAESSLRV